MAKKSEKPGVTPTEPIPTLTSEEEEARFWSEHQPSEEMLQAMEPLAEDLLPPSRNAD